MPDAYTLLPGGNILRIGERPEEGDYEVIGPPLDELPRIAVGIVEQTVQRMVDQIWLRSLVLVAPPRASK